MAKLLLRTPAERRRVALVVSPVGGVVREMCRERPGGTRAGRVERTLQDKSHAERPTSGGRVRPAPGEAERPVGPDRVTIRDLPRETEGRRRGTGRRLDDHVEASHCLREALDLKAETPTLIRRAAVRSELGADAWGWGVRGEGHGAGVALVVDAATVVDDVPRQRAPDRARAREHSLDDGRVAREVDGRGEGPVALHLDV